MKTKKLMREYLVDGIFYALMLFVVILCLNVIYSTFNKASAGTIAECETDEQCEKAAIDSLLIIDQRSIPIALKYYCEEYPNRWLGIGVWAKQLNGDPIEIETCAQVNTKEVEDV